MRDYYDVLGVSPGAGAEEISAVPAAGSSVSSRHLGDDRAVAFLEASRAYEVLADPTRRRSYDAKRTTTAASPRMSRANWFADEVAIDFPSVSDLLDSMRHAFFGADALEELSAEVDPDSARSVSGHDCSDGDSRPPDCLQCGGRGETWQESCELCGGCGDLRTFHDVELRVPAGVRGGERFRFSVMPAGAPLTRVDIVISVRSEPRASVDTCRERAVSASIENERSEYPKRAVSASAGNVP